MPYSDLGQRAKAAYNGAYDDVPDEEFGQFIANKYPAYANRVDPTPSPTAAPQQSQPDANGIRVIDNSTPSQPANTPSRGFLDPTSLDEGWNGGVGSFLGGLGLNAAKDIPGTLASLGTLAVKAPLGLLEKGYNALTGSNNDYLGASTYDTNIGQSINRIPGAIQGYVNDPGSLVHDVGNMAYEHPLQAAATVLDGAGLAARGVGAATDFASGASDAARVAELGGLTPAEAATMTVAPNGFTNAADVLQNLSSRVNPANIGMNAIGGIKNAIGGATTGVTGALTGAGKDAVDAAVREGQVAGEGFATGTPGAPTNLVDQMRSPNEMSLVNNAHDAVANMIEQRRNDYLSGRDSLTGQTAQAGTELPLQAIKDNVNQSLEKNFGITTPIASPVERQIMEDFVNKNYATEQDRAALSAQAQALYQKYGMDGGPAATPAILRTRSSFQDRSPADFPSNQQIHNAFTESLNKNGVIGPLNFDATENSRFPSSNSSLDGTRKSIQEISNQINKGDSSTLTGLDTLKQNLGDYSTKDPVLKAMVAQTQDAIRQPLVENVPGYAQWQKEYADHTGILNQLRALKEGGDPTKTFKTLLKVAGRKDQLGQSVRAALESAAPGTLGSIAGFKLSGVMPNAGILGKEAAGLGAVAFTHPATAIPTIAAGLPLAAASSPRLVGEAARAAGYVGGVAKPFVQGIKKAAGGSAGITQLLAQVSGKN